MVNGMLTAIIERVERGGVAMAGSAGLLVGRHAALLGVLFLLAYTAAVALAGFFFPENNWDMVAYLAIVLEKAIGDPQVLHQTTWDIIRRSVPPGDFVVLTEDRPYRVAQYTDASGFYSMLGFYRVKWLYVQTIAALSHVMDPVTAMRVISSAASAGIGLAVMGWLMWARRLAWAPLAVAALLVAGFGYVARLATPDALATLFFLVGVLAYLRGRETVVAMMLAAAFLTRPDHLAFIGVFMVVTAYMRPASLGAVAAFIVCAAMYVPLTAAAGHPGWWVQFWFTDVEYVPTIAGFHPDFSLVVYLKALVQSIVRVLVEEGWFGLMIAAVCGWLALEAADMRPGARERALLVALLLAMAAKFVILPLHEARFYFAYVIAFAMVVITAAPPMLSVLFGHRPR